MGFRILRHPEKGKCRSDRIPDVRYPGGMSAEKESGCDMSGWNVGGRTEFRMECRWRRSPDVICPDGMLRGRTEFRMRYVRVKCRRRRSPDMICPDGIPDVRHSGWNVGGEEVRMVICPDGM